MGWPVWSLCQIAAVRARMRCRIRVRTPVGVPAVLYEVELTFVGVEDRLDALAEWLEESGSSARGFALAGRVGGCSRSVGGGCCIGWPSGRCRGGRWLGRARWWRL